MTKYPYISENKCLCCNGEITIKRSRDVNNKYCSSGCVGKHLHKKIKEIAICQNCNREFEKRYNNKNIFCCRTCQIENRIKKQKNL